MGWREEPMAAVVLLLVATPTDLQVRELAAWEPGAREASGSPGRVTPSYPYATSSRGL